VVDSVGSGGTETAVAGAEVGFGGLGFFVLGFATGFAVAERPVAAFGFTLTGRATVLTTFTVDLMAAVRMEAVRTGVVRMGVVRMEVERRSALAGVSKRPMPRKTVSPTARRFRQSRATGRRTPAEESVTPGNAFDMGQGYARDVTIR
jgi:hypothetical protein